MKKLLAISLLFSLLLSLAACGPSAPSTQEPEPTDTAAQTTDPSIETAPSTTFYSRYIWRMDFPVHENPNYDYAPTGTIGIEGDYNIVQEQFDDEDNLWGKLESGAGWIDLTLLQAEQMLRPAVTIGYANHQNLTDPYYCEVDTSKYAVGIALHAHEMLTDISMFRLEVGETYTPGATFFEIPAWVPGRALVAQVSFPEDFSAYGLRFTDSQGQTHTYMIAESGRNGAVYMSEY